jgi:hypothetical protein
MESLLLDAAGHRRSPATMPGYHCGRAPRNKGEQYPADPPTIEEIIEVMRAIGERLDGFRLGALIELLWRAGLIDHGERRRAPHRQPAVEFRILRREQRSPRPTPTCWSSSRAAM